MSIAMDQNEVFRQPVECIVSVDDEPITDLYPYLKEVSVAMRRDKGTVGTFIFETLRDNSCSWIVQDAGGEEPLLTPWRRMKIEAKFDAGTEEVMRGYIKNVSVDYPQDMSAATVTVSVQDESILLDREHVRTSWSNAEDSRNDGDIVTEISENHQLTADVKPGLDNVSLQNSTTFVKFIEERARVNGYEFYVREETLHFHPPELEAGEHQATILVYAGLATNCLKFSARYDGHHPDEVALTRAAETGSDIEEESFTPDLVLLGKYPVSSESMGLDPFVWYQEGGNGATIEEGNARAQAAANSHDWKIVADGELDGVVYGHVLLNFKTVIVDGVGSTYGGVYYVDQVTHRFTPDGYRQTFRLIRNAIGDDTEAAASNTLGGV